MGKITLKQVRKSFGDVHVIPGVDLTIEDGEFVVFVGPSGCGKSTLLRLIAGLEDTTSGIIAIDGKDATRPAARQARHCDGVPVLRALPAYDGAQEHRLRLKMAGMPEAEIEAARGARRQGAEPVQLSRPPPRPAFGRPAAARRHRPRHRARTVRLPVRRAAVEPRCGAARSQMRLEISELHQR
jgi:multiple sugar transport system ATP-binding protein